MQPDSRKRLAEMLAAATSIQQFVAGFSFEQFHTNDLLRSAVYYKFAIIGEALAQLRQTDEPLLSLVTESDRIIAFRNQLIHGYALMDDEVTWRIVKLKLPVLLSDLAALLAD
jgi:uncharacterized protein with HEPN domain